jgi:hypothetical protein
MKRNLYAFKKRYIVIFKEEGLKEETNATEHTLHFGIYCDLPKNLDDKLGQNVLSSEDFFN